LPSSSHPSYPHAGQHDLGQNDLHDPRVAAAMARHVAATSGPVVELGAGHGALTRALAAVLTSGRQVTAVELDPARAERLRRRRLPGVHVVTGDALRHPLPDRPHVVVGNLPFHLTTPVLRRLLHQGRWTDAVLLVQWEVARKRAAIGGTTLLTARWWPWFDVVLGGRVPATAFRPVPAVDGGILLLHRRPQPLVADRDGYQRLTHTVFTGRGHGLGQILPRTGTLAPGAARAWLRRERLAPQTLPRDLTLDQWLSLWRATRLDHG
jgi:23S rRNA (adenine-N6)-dimethyltransferase